jgi:hypothetical protein
MTTPPEKKTPPLPRYLVTVRIADDPTRTRDHSLPARSAWHAGWLYRQLNPGARLVAIRPVPEGR